MSGFILSGAGLITGIAAALACKIFEGSDDSAAKLRIMIAFILCSADIRFAAPQDFGELLMASVGILIGFGLFYYIIYGIMSASKVSDSLRLIKRCRGGVSWTT